MYPNQWCNFLILNEPFLHLPWPYQSPQLLFRLLPPSFSSRLLYSWANNILLEANVMYSEINTWNDGPTWSSSAFKNAFNSSCFLSDSSCNFWQNAQKYFDILIRKSEIKLEPTLSHYMPETHLGFLFFDSRCFFGCFLWQWYKRECISFTQRTLWRTYTFLFNYCKMTYLGLFSGISLCLFHYFLFEEQLLTDEQ